MEALSIRRVFTQRQVRIEHDNADHCDQWDESGDAQFEFQLRQ
jgi:hypothetical protein